MIGDCSSPLEQNDTPAAHSCQLQCCVELGDQLCIVFEWATIRPEPATGNVKCSNENGT
jgi:hypothetical protein